MPETIDTVIADMRSDAQSLRRNRDERTADVLEAWAKRVEGASEEVRVFLSEDKAMLRAGLRKPDALRRRYPEWERDGHAYTERGRRYYRMLVVPTRAKVRAARAAGRRGDAGGSASGSATRVP